MDRRKAVVAMVVEVVESNVEHTPDLSGRCHTMSA
jgi:hypothetical protein